MNPAARIADAEASGEFAQRGGFFADEAFFPDHDVAPFESGLEGVEFTFKEVAEFLVCDEFLGEGVIGGHEVALFGGGVVVDGGVEADVAEVEAEVHFDDVAFFDFEVFGEPFGGGFDALGEELFAGAVEVVIKFALGLGGADLHESVVIHEVFEDVGADPPLGVAREADLAVGVEAANGVDEAEVTFLDEVEEVVLG